MTHVGYVVASYGLALVIGAGLAVAAWRRVGRARRRLEEIDPRRRRETAPNDHRETMASDRRETSA